MEKEWQDKTERKAVLFLGSRSQQMWNHELTIIESKHQPYTSTPDSNGAKYGPVSTQRYKLFHHDKVT